MHNRDDLDPEWEMIDGTKVKDWPNCPIPDCENKICIWGGEGLCHPCSVRKVGKAEMERRYHETH